MLIKSIYGTKDAVDDNTRYAFLLNYLALFEDLVLDNVRYEITINYSYSLPVRILLVTSLLSDLTFEAAF